MRTWGLLRTGERMRKGEGLRCPDLDVFGDLMEEGLRWKKVKEITSGCWVMRGNTKRREKRV